MAAENVPVQHIFLTGYRGTGKTSVGKIVASLLGRDWLDLDTEIERHVGISVAEIFSQEGEAGFRDRESEALARTRGLSPSVISLGGGAVLRPVNRQLVAESGECVWLRASSASICQRLSSDPRTSSLRPSLTGLSLEDEVHKLLLDREPCYREVAQFAVDTDELSVDEIADRIASWWQQNHAD